MNISKTAPKIIQKPVTNPAEEKNSTITISIPEVDADKFVSGGWGLVDGIGAAVFKSGRAGAAGIASAIPVIGLNFSQGIRKDMAKGDMEANSVNQIANIGVSLGQLGGFGLAGLAGVSAVTGVGPSVGLLKASLASFAGAGLAGVVMGYASA